MLAKLSKRAHVYFAFIKYNIIGTLMYRASVISWFIGTAITAIAGILLWNAIYAELPPGTVVNGFTFNQMIMYLITAVLLSFVIGSRNTFYDVGKDIHEGDIANNLVKPINYRLRMLFTTFGGAIGCFVIIFMPIYIIATIILYFTLGCPFPMWYEVLLFFLSIIFALIIVDSFDFIIAQLAFVTGGYFGLMLLENTLISFMSGAIIPLSFISGMCADPKLADILFRLANPFAGITTTPTYLLIHHFDSWETALINVAIQAGWAILLLALSLFTYKKMIKHVVSVGG